MPDFIVRIISLLRKLPNTAENKEIGRQIIRSASSIGANYTEAQYARTQSEFYSTIKISLREAAETVWWLELLSSVNDQKFRAEINELIREGSELCKIFASISLKKGQR